LRAIGDLTIGRPARYDAAGPAMNQFKGVSEKTRAEPPRRWRGVQILGQWMVVVGILVAVLGIVAQLLTAAGTSRAWNLFGDPRLVRADRMPAADFGIIIVGLAAGGLLVLVGGLVLAVRGRR
jgi:hypothetical protein